MITRTVGSSGYPLAVNHGPINPVHPAVTKINGKTVYPLNGTKDPIFKAFTEGMMGGPAGTIENVATKTGNKFAEEALIKAQNLQLTKQLDKVIKHGSGTIENVSPLFSHLVSLGIHPKEVVNFTQNELKRLGHVEGPINFNGSHVLNVVMEPTEQQLKHRVNALYRGTVERFTKEGEPVLSDFVSSTEHLANDAQYAAHMAENKAIEALTVPIDQGVSTVDALVKSPSHLIDDWAMFRNDHPRAPYRVERVSKEGQVYHMGPHGEHPVGVSSVRTKGGETGHLYSPDLNSKLFWLPGIVNILKGAANPEKWPAQFTKQYPNLAKHIMPEGGYVASKWKNAVDELKSEGTSLLDYIP